MSQRAVTFDRPVAATLVIRLTNGEEWEATPEDLDKFNLVDRNVGYQVFAGHLRRVLLDAGLIDRDKDLGRCGLNAIRHFAEIAFTMPQFLGETDWRGIDESLVRIERALRAAGLAEIDADTMPVDGLDGNLVTGLVDVIAREMARQDITDGGEDPWAGLDESRRAGWRDRAAAVVRQIVPMLAADGAVIAAQTPR